MYYVFDGVDGLGKTYCINYIKEALEQKGIQISHSEGSKAKQSMPDYSSTEAKELFWLSSAVDAHEAASRQPEIILRDRGILTLLTYAKRNNMRGYSFYKEAAIFYASILPKPRKVFLFLGDFNLELVKQKQGWEKYYSDFRGDNLKEGFEQAAQYLEDIYEIVKCYESKIEGFSSRNERILKMIYKDLGIKE